MTRDRARVCGALSLLLCAACAGDSTTQLPQGTATGGAGTRATSAGTDAVSPRTAAGSAPSGSAGVAAGPGSRTPGSGGPGAAGPGSGRAPSGSAGTGAPATAGSTAAAMSGSAGLGVRPPAAGTAAGAAGRTTSGSAGAGATPAAGSGASGPCEFPDPPAEVADWVEQSWNAQLGMNVKSRKAWLLDNVILNKGSLNLCVRWGATSAMPDSLRTNLAATTERWFNDWFKGLAGYGCFPHGAGISVKITGYAVRAGKQSLLGAVDPAIPVYTETDGDGEPKCPDACSSFVHWDHQFGSCQGGDAAHSDYWLWFDDKLPGNGGAAAVGGDWGLRMPVSTFVGAFEQPSFHITEHEMGHGFGIQDYYDWTGAKPKGGSIMIVGSTNSEPPTAADIWLLKRTWKEMKKLRGW